jgi:hypothetical protein
MDESFGDSSQLRHHSPLLQGAIDGLFYALATWRTVAVRLAAGRFPRRNRQSSNSNTQIAAPRSRGFRISGTNGRRHAPAASPRSVRSAATVGRQPIDLGWRTANAACISDREETIMGKPDESRPAGTGAEQV